MSPYNTCLSLQGSPDSRLRVQRLVQGDWGQLLKSVAETCSHSCPTGMHPELQLTFVLHGHFHHKLLAGSIKRLFPECFCLRESSRTPP